MVTSIGSLKEMHLPGTRLFQVPRVRVRKKRRVWSQLTDTSLDPFSFCRHRGHPPPHSPAKDTCKWFAERKEQ